jgi:hypothetical protein
MIPLRSVKRRSFSHPVSLFKSVFFSPIIILFLQYSCSWNMTHTGFDVQYFIQSSLIASFLRSLCSTFVLWKVGGHEVMGKETLKFWSIFGSLPDFPSLRGEKMLILVFSIQVKMTPSTCRNGIWKLKALFSP